MLRILVCSEIDLRRDLAPTLVGRQGIEVFRAHRFEEARLLVSALDPRAILVDRDLPRAREFVETLRKDPVTRPRSVAVLARGGALPGEAELLASGANALLRLPPDSGWDERLSRLLTVPSRNEARLLVRLVVATDPEISGAILDLSAGGMRLATQQRLKAGDAIGFRFRLPDGTTIEGRGRVVREAARTEYGVEFDELRAEWRDAIRQFQRSARFE